MARRARAPRQTVRTRSRSPDDDAAGPSDLFLASWRQYDAGISTRGRARLISRFSPTFFRVERRSGSRSSVGRRIPRCGVKPVYPLRAGSLSFEPPHLLAEFVHAGLLDTSITFGLGDGVADAGRRADDKGAEDDAHGEDSQPRPDVSLPCPRGGIGDERTSPPTPQPAAGADGPEPINTQSLRFDVSLISEGYGPAQANILLILRTSTGRLTASPEITGRRRSVRRPGRSSAVLSCCRGGRPWLLWTS